MSELLEKIIRAESRKKPEHIAIIMDGNGRWAKQQGQERVYGHQNGVTAVRSIIEGAGEAGVRFLTLFAFSTENWNRPEAEVNALTALLVQTINMELDRLMKNRVRLLAIGDLRSLPGDCQEHLAMAMDKTKENTGLTVILALSYSARWELTEMAKRIGTAVLNGEILPENITPETVANHLTTAGIPDPDILIRTGGEFRVSNFLLWQISYTELFFSTIMWPEFRKDDLWQIILDYMSRQRRFGKTGEQVNSH